MKYMLALSVVSALSLFMQPALSQSTTFDILPNGDVGISAGASPEARLHVGGVEDAKVLVANTSLTATPLTLFEIRNRGNVRFQMTNTNANKSWVFNAGTAGNTPTGENSFRISAFGDAPEFSVFEDGNATLVGTMTATSFVQSSDRNAKQDFVDVNRQAILDKVVALPITEWSYKQEPSSRHIGPMAQDFFAAFELGKDDTGLYSVDMGGITLAAIQGLKQEKDEEITRLTSLSAKQDEKMAQVLSVVEAQQERIIELEMALAEILRTVGNEKKVSSLD